MSDCAKLQTGCDPEVLATASQTGHAPVFSACLPFGGRLYSTGGFVNFQAPTPPPDGTYTSITIEGGCITGVGYADISTYSTTPCAPVPCDCGAGSAAITVSSSISNLSRLDPAGALLTTLTVSAGDGISITGSGATTDPLIISSNPTTAASVFVAAGNSGIVVQGSGTQNSPFTIAHAEQASAQNINGMTFDRYGHLTGYTARTTAGTINGVIGGDGVSVDTNVSTGVATISLAPALHSLAGDYMFGGYEVELDDNNRIYSIGRQITLSNATYRLGRYDVSINSYGSVTGVRRIADNIVTGPVCTHLASAQSSAVLTFSLADAASLKVEVEGKTSVSAMTVTVDGRAAPGATLGSKYIALTTAIYAAGQHTVSISGSMQADTFITVTPVTAI